jgi:hypothetical protein
MPKIIDPDLLADSAADDGSTEVFINVATKRIKLVVTGDLVNTGVQDANGVTLKALYSFLKEEWRNDPHAKNLAAIPFPIEPITDESFEFKDGWNFENDTARYLIRDAGWAVKNLSGVFVERWAGVIGLGSIESDDQLYFQQASGGTTTNVQLTGQVNQAVQIYRDDDGDGITAEASDFDRRTYFALFAREQAQKYGKASLTDIGVATLAPQAYRFPISTSSDSIKITVADVGIDANSDNAADVAPYTGMSITYFATPQVRSIGGTNRDFGIIIDGNAGTAEQIYQFVQWSLRRTTDIDAGAGSLVGKIADELLEFVGDTLKTKTAANPAGGGTGVFIDDYQTVDETRLVFRDNTGTERTFPYNAVLTINFGDNLKNDASAKYWLYFDTLPGAGNDFGEAGAIIVNDKDGNPITGTVGGATSLQKSFAYDTNTQGGRTAATDAAVVAVGIGLATGQYVRASVTIQRTTANAVALVAPLERTYANP